MRRGEIWWLEEPDDKPRPFLVLARDEIIDRVHDVLAVPVTTTRRGIPTEVDLDADDGMARSCVLSVDNLQPIPRAYCTRRITTLGPERLDEVCRALRIAIDC